MTCRRRSSWAAAGSLRMSTCLMPAQFGASQPQLKTMRSGDITALPGPPIAHAQDSADRSGKTAALQTSYVHACQPVWQPNQTGQKLLATYLASTLAERTAPGLTQRASVPAEGSRVFPS